MQQQAEHPGLRPLEIESAVVARRQKPARRLLKPPAPHTDTLIHPGRNDQSRGGLISLCDAEVDEEVGKDKRCQEQEELGEFALV